MATVMRQLTRLEKVIEAIFDVLPADNYYDLSKKVNSAKRLNVDTGEISNALSILRANPKEYGYVVPHIKRGPGSHLDKGRLFALLVDRDGHYELDSNPDALRHFGRGLLATLSEATTKLTNEGGIVRIAATHTRSVNLRARLNDVADDMEYVVRKAAAVMREVRTSKVA